MSLQLSLLQGYKPLMHFSRSQTVARLVTTCAFFIFLTYCLVLTSTANARPPKRILVVTVTKGFRHDSIPMAEAVIGALGLGGGWETDFARTDEDIAQKMTADALKKYDGVVFANTTGDLPLPDRAAFLAWLRSGKAFIGVHSATDTFHGWQEYLSFLGGEFLTHGPQVEVSCINDDPTHPATREKEWGLTRNVYDEIYQLKGFDPARVHSLLRLDKHPNNKTPGNYPISWTRVEGKGRVFYTSLGHRQEVWTSSWYQVHVRGGIRWALGLEKGNDTPGLTPSLTR